ncbi:hypothetical protein BDW74DRAFT_141363 [Aspergillus multicolor]|uniref:uncharacterized protein n=1 Tax=Aspergillus multicolor TaxID=41759 RepID=UPI003CCDFCF8
MGIYTDGTDSTCLLLVCAWGTWTRLAGMRGYKLVFEMDGLHYYNGSPCPLFSWP